MEKNTMTASLARLRKLPVLAALVLAGIGSQVQAQTFSSGSTGADGAFAPTADQTLTVPASGVFNFTTITIPPNVRITFTRNAANSPVTILATGDVTIAGTIDVSGGDGTITVSGTGTGSQVFHTVPGIGGPGGYDGGGGGVVTTFSSAANGTAGEGPGGGGGGLGSADGSVLGDGGGGGFGTAGAAGARTGSTTGNDGAGGVTYGAASLLQLVGGSGGGGGGGGFQNQGDNSVAPGGSGGGGGGAIVIASSGTVTFGSGSNSGTVDAHGGSGGSYYQGGGHGGGGAGGAIRVVATTVAGSVSANVQGEYGSAGGKGGDGYPPRFEAYNFSSFEATVISSYTASFQPVYAQPSSVTLPSPPQLLITSVAGLTAPSVPNGSFHKAPDITLPTAQTDPVVVGIQGANIPLGTAVSVEVSPEQGPPAFVQSTPLVGTDASSTTATASVILPPALMSILYAAATIDLTPPSPGGHLRGNVVRKTVLGQPPLTLNGEAVVRVEVTQAFGGKAGVVYITKSGKRISREQLLGKEAHPAH